MLAAGTDVAGFRIERVLRRDAGATVYEATQEGLSRRVALTLHRPGPHLADRFRAIGAIEHPHIASLYAAGDSEHGFFTATRLVQGPTLAQLADEGRLGPALAERLCDQVGRALEQAHGAGVVHGAVSPSNVLVADGRHAILTAFAPAEDAATAAGDRAELAGMRARYARSAEGRMSHRRRVMVRGLAVLAAGLVGVAGVGMRGSDPDRETVAGPPPPARGVVPLGSSLTAPTARSFDCDGAAPSGASLACTVMQTRLGGRRVAVPEDGAIRGWVVRAARGELALHVIRRRADGFVVVASTQLRAVGGDGVRVLPADLAVRRGDRIGIELAPGSAIGVGVPAADAAAERFVGPLRGNPRRPTRTLEGRFRRELFVRVDYVAGASPRRPRILAGAAAADAPAGRALARRDVDVAGRVRMLVLVVVRGQIALDLFAGSRRLSRMPIPDADPRGRLFRLDVPDATVIWRNPDGRLTEHGFTTDTGVALGRRAR